VGEGEVLEDFQNDVGIVEHGDQAQPAPEAMAAPALLLAVNGLAVFLIGAVRFWRDTGGASATCSMRAISRGPPATPSASATSGAGATGATTRTLRSPTNDGDSTKGWGQSRQDRKPRGRRSATGFGSTCDGTSAAHSVEKHVWSSVPRDMIGATDREAP
jgi:hypothetical protein